MTVRTCAFCGESLCDRRADARNCSGACRAEESRTRRKGSKTGADAARGARIAREDTALARPGAVAASAKRRRANTSRRQPQAAPLHPSPAPLGGIYDGGRAATRPHVPSDTPLRASGGEAGG